MNDPASVYEQARRHGLGHAAALHAAEKGELVCWCGSRNPCDGGALRQVGCPHARWKYIGRTIITDEPEQLDLDDETETFHDWMLRQPT